MDNKQIAGNKQEILLNQARIAKAAARKLSILPTDTKNAALLAMANALRHRKEAILEANAQDMAAAKEKKMSASFMDRLLLTDERIEDMSDGLRALAVLTDPSVRWTPCGLAHRICKLARFAYPLAWLASFTRLVPM